MSKAYEKLLAAKNVLAPSASRSDLYELYDPAQDPSRKIPEGAVFTRDSGFRMDGTWTERLTDEERQANIRHLCEQGITPS